MIITLPISQLINKENIKRFNVEAYQIRSGVFRDCKLDINNKMIFHDSKGIVCNDWAEHFNKQVIGFDIACELYSTNLAPACENYEKVKGGGFEYYGALGPILSKDGIKAVIRNKIKNIKNYFPKVALENSNRYPYPAHSHISDPVFITEVLEENDIYFCFDIAHAIISYRNWYYTKYETLMNN